MFLSDRDIKWAVESGKLIVTPQPTAYDENSIDLQLDTITNARVWDTDAVEVVRGEHRSLGADAPAAIAGCPVLNLGAFDYRQFAGRFLVPVPTRSPGQTDDDLPRVFQDHGVVYVRPLGFVLWTTLEVVGTPEGNPELLSFVNAKSTKARTGVMVHFTAPTINAGWSGKITLEITNLGPFVLALRPGDKIAQLTVATISSRPDPRVRGKMGSVTMGQIDPSGRSTSPPPVT